MSAHKVLTSVPIGKVMKKVAQGTGVVEKTVELAVALATTEWSRPEEVAKAQGPGFDKAVKEHVAALPAGTAKLVSRQVQTLILY